MVIEYCTMLVTCLVNSSFSQHFIATKKLLFRVHQYTYITLDTMCEYVIFFSEGQKCRMTRISKICIECPKSVTWTPAALQLYCIRGVGVWDSLFAPLLDFIVFIHSFFNNQVIQKPTSRDTPYSPPPDTTLTHQLRTVVLVREAYCINGQDLT